MQPPGYDSDSEDDLPPAWEERVSLDGRVYYVHHVEKVTQWRHPRTGKKKIVPSELPFGWERVIDDSGKVIYVDHENKKTTFTDPRLAFAVEDQEGGERGLRQRFDASSSALHVLHGRDLSGRVALVTGANSGIGYETARSLAYHGCRVVFACRNLESARAAIEQIKSERANSVCEPLHCDLASLAGVRRAAGEFLSRHRHLHMLVLNAGLFAPPYALTEDGLEAQFGVNHLGHYCLTRLLEPALARTRGARVVVVSSESHRLSRLSAEDFTLEKLSRPADKYTGIVAYNDSKLCNNLFAAELHRRWRPKGVTVSCVHPGNMVSSSLSRHWWLWRLLFAAVRPFTKSLCPDLRPAPSDSSRRPAPVCTRPRRPSWTAWAASTSTTAARARCRRPPPTRSGRAVSGRSARRSSPSGWAPRRSGRQSPAAHRLRRRRPRASRSRSEGAQRAPAALREPSEPQPPALREPSEPQRL
ncbi:WW domain-containing oxidoreductase-like isoform X1 [Amphibalanus amphitrite]|uniref:WW domain-containing oxidoreductase-like isoform X1 n=1 Tax=Amphibalanus amphitrite TaxID=1232801 RepID=UPI001C91071E|nr:WW domain-containing oxidoreductase-like isoform X1 [Amphibalanus amphitrite]